jgi:hypothetical protein
MVMAPRNPCECCCFLQEVVYLSDPLAFYHVLVKDQHIFEEPDTFIMSVFHWSFNLIR